MKRFSFLIAACLATLPALATNGYFAHGYGMNAKGRGGASVAYDTDAFGGANNPATMAFVGNRLDVGVDLFSPDRSSSRSGFGPGLDGEVKSDSTLFAIPEFGYNRSLGQKLSLGVTVYGNGGMNTNYAGGQFNCGQGPANMLCGAGSLGVDLSQLIVAPTIAFKLSDNQSLGVAPMLAYQRFKASGLQAFAGTPGLSSNPSAVTNNGYDSSTGAGVRVGYFARLSSGVSLGVSYATKTSMGKFKKYAGLFAESGGFDIPEHYALGLRMQASQKLSVGLDLMRIRYSQIASVGDQVLVPAQLGGPNGPGFGWRDINVVKLGIEYAATGNWTLRGGFNRGGNPIEGRNVTFNILAPGVVENHLTLGMTRHFSGQQELTLAYMHAFNQSVSGASVLPVFQGGMPFGTETIQMQQNSFGVAWGRKF